MAIGIQLIALIPPLVMQQMIDVYLPGKDWHRIITGIILLLYLSVMLLLSNYFTGKAQKFINQVVENKGKAAQLLTDTFLEIKLVKASVIEEYRLEKLKKVNQDTVSVWAKVVALDNLSGI